MPSLHRFPPYVIAAAVLFMITFYHVYNIRSKNSDLERNVKVFKEALSVSKEKNKVLVKDAMEKVEKRDARIQQLEKEHLEKHTKLGETQSKLAKVQSDLQSSQDEIEKLHQSAASHRAEISTLTKSVVKSKKTLTKLAAKAENLMLDHKKLTRKNTELQQQNEKLQSDIKLHQSVRDTLNDRVNRLKTEKEDLGLQVDDLKRKNEVIQESIKQKIKESYARREMIQAKHTQDTEDQRARLGMLQNSTHKTMSIGQRDTEAPKRLFKSSEEDQVPRAIVHNSDRSSVNLSKTTTNSIDDQNAMLKTMVDKSDTASESKIIESNSNDSDSRNIMVNNSEVTQSNVSRILVDNNVEDKEKWDAKNSTAAKNNSKNGEESVRSRPVDRLDDQSQGENHFSLTGFQSEKATEHVDQRKNEDFGRTMQNGNMDRQGLDENKDVSVERTENGNMGGETLNENKDENFERRMENGNTDRDVLDENKDGNFEIMENGNMGGKGLIDENMEDQEHDGNTKRASPGEERDNEDMRTGKQDHGTRTEEISMPVFPNIKDEIINRQSSNTYGNHFDRASSKQNAEPFDQTNN